MKRAMPELDVAAKCLVFLFAFLALAACVEALGGCSGAVFEPAPDARDAAVAEEAATTEEAGSDTASDMRVSSDAGCCLPGYYCPGHPLCQDASSD
jgi:hypothetical protein